ncbi:MAG: NIL domain-containing protein [Eubacterium sp.]
MIKKIVLNFPQETTGKPIASQLIKEFDLELNILKAYVDDDVNGTLLFEVTGLEKNIEDGIAFIKKSGVDIKEVVSVIDVDENKCVSCGACTAACVVGALKMDENWQLKFYADKCLECTLCIKACPTRAIHTLI